MSTLNLGFLASHGGTSMRAIVAAIIAGELNGRARMGRTAGGDYSGGEAQLGLPADSTRPLDGPGPRACGCGPAGPAPW